MKGRQIKYSPEELEWLEERKDWPRSTLHSVFVMLFERQDVALMHIKSLCDRRLWKTGRDGCFAKGHAPANKGKPCAEGTGGRHPNARRTQFKKGDRKGKAHRNYKPVGFERLSKDGYLERKVHDGMPFQSRWRPVHILRWEEVHGAIPRNHCLKCLDGDFLNTDPANWELVHRAVLLRLNGGPNKRHLAFDEASPEVRPTLIAIAKVDHAARVRGRKTETEAAA